MKTRNNNKIRDGSNKVSVDKCGNVFYRDRIIEPRIWQNRPYVRIPSIGRIGVHQIIAYKKYGENYLQDGCFQVTLMHLVSIM